MNWAWQSKSVISQDAVNFGALDVGWRKEAHTIHDAPGYSGENLKITVIPDIMHDDEEPSLTRATEVDLAARTGSTPLMVPEAIRSPGLTLQPLTV